MLLAILQPSPALQAAGNNLFNHIFWVCVPLGVIGVVIMLLVETLSPKARSRRRR
jgi:lipopolysaccharide export LptBFGC system permease protein LptF